MGKAKRPLGTNKKAAANQGIPLCPVMAICNQVVVGDDKVATLVRVVDTIGVSPSEEQVVGEIGEFPGLTLYIALKRGDSSGTFLLTLSAIDPTGKRMVTGTISYQATGGPEAGASVIGPFRVVWGGEGLYWLELTTENKKLVARTPIRIHIGEQDEIKKRIADGILKATARRKQK